MTDRIEIKSNIPEVIHNVKQFQAFVEKQVKNAVNVASMSLLKYIRLEKFGPYPSGTTDKTLSIRSKRLWRSLAPIPARVEGNEVFGGLTIGTKYAATHFGKAGQVTTIKGNPWLAIPLPSALDKHGVSKGGPQDSAIFGNTFIAKSKQGNLIIFGKLKYTKGKKAGETKGDIVPLFVLKHEVKIPVRITDDDLQRFVGPIIGKSMKIIKQGVKDMAAI